MKKLHFYFLMAFFLLQPVLADIVINEIMYDPEGSDNNREFIEIFSGNYINLTGFIISDSDSNDTLAEMQYYDSGYALIVEEGFNYSSINASVYSAGAAIGNNLGNDEDNITLFYPNGTIAAFVGYFSSWGANGDGYTLEKINPSGSDSQDNWGISLVINGTPGYQNSIYGTGGINYSLINITEFLPDPEGDDDAPMPDGEWIELYNPTNTAMDLKWMFFKDLAGHYLYITDINVKDSTVIPANSYLIVYTNGKSGFLNNEGMELLEFYNKDGELIKNISYIDPVEGNSYAYVEGIGWQHTKPTPGEENVNHSAVQDSYLKIENIYDLGSDDTAKFGQTIRVKVNIYKGDTTKNSIALYVENKRDRISKQSKTSVYTKYTTYELTIPIQLYPNCNEEFDDDSYYVYANGLDKEDKKEIDVEGITASLCETVEKSSSSKTRGVLSYNLINFPKEAENNDEIVSEIELDNDGDEDIVLEVWSYVYRGSKSYSGEREENKITVDMPSHSQKTVQLYNTVSDAEPGDYKIKTKIQQTTQTTAKEITEDIKLVSSKQPINDNKSAETNPFIRDKGIVYESSTIKSNKTIPYLIITLTTLLSIILIWKR